MDRTLRYTSRALLAVGVAIALFVVYELFLTGLQARRSQAALIGEFKDAVASGAASSSDPGTEGAAVALIDIPGLGLSEAVVEGTSPGDLKEGPGHLRGSPMPGEFGNAVIIGRRTTYGGPFASIDRLGKGDAIMLTSGSGSFEYDVTRVARTDAGQADPLNGTLDSRLTLVTSDPAYHPDGRLVVTATLRGKPLDVPIGALPPVSSSDLGLAGDAAGAGLALAWAVVLAIVVWLRPRVTATWPRRVRFIVVAPVLMALTVLVLTNLDSALPGAT